MGNVVLRPMSKGELLDGAFTLYRRNFITFVVVGLIFAVPQLLLTKLIPLAAMVINSFLGIMLAAAMIWIAAEATLGRSPSIGGAVKTGIKKCLPLFGAGVVVGFLALLGFICLVIPMFLVMIMAFAIGPVVVVENRSGAFSRSRELAKRAWGHIALLTLVAMCITWLPMIGIGVVSFFLQPTDAASGGALVAANANWLTTAAPLVGALIQPFSQSLTTLMYFDQRVRKEGFGIEAQAAALGQAAPATTQK